MYMVLLWHFRGSLLGALENIPVTLLFLLLFFDDEALLLMAAQLDCTRYYETIAYII